MNTNKNWHTISLAIAISFLWGFSTPCYVQAALPSIIPAGLVLYDINTLESCSEILQQSSKIITVAALGNNRGGVDSPQTDMVVVRFDSNGKLDPTFGINGRIRIGPAAAGADIDVTGINGSFCIGAIQSDGKIVLSGWTYQPPDNFYRIRVLRLLSNGQLDQNFGTNGLFELSHEIIGFQESMAGKIAIDSAQRIIIAGRFDTPFSTVRPQGLVFRLTNNGVIDTSFNGGTGFFKWTQSAQTNAYFTGITTQPDNSILVGGCSGSYCGSYSSDPIILRLTSGGELDTNFADGGVRYLPLISDANPSQSMPGNKEIKLISVDSLGRIVATGINNYSGSIGITYRLDANGNLDPSYINDYFVPHNVPVSQRVDSTGVLFVGSTFRSYYDDYVGLLKLDSNGVVQPFPTFPQPTILENSNGETLWRMIFDGYLCSEPPGGAIFQPDGKIVVAGNFGCGYQRVYQGIYLARFNPDSSIDETFGTGTSQTPWEEPPEQRSESGAGCETPQTGRNAVVITHGWNSDAATWVNDMAKSICSQVGGTATEPTPNQTTKLCAGTQWDVWVDDWRDKAAKKLPKNAWVNAQSVGEKLATTLQSCAYQHVHFIAHSAGSNVIDTAVRAMRGTTTIHETFFDAYDPSAGIIVTGICPSQGYCEFNKNFGSAYGQLADWADNYVDTRQLLLAASEPFDYTKLQMQAAYNVDVTPESDDCGVIDPVCVHAWPYRYYQSTIGAPISSLGFPLSREAGQPLWTQGGMQDQYPRGAGVHISTPGWQSPPKKIKTGYVPMSGGTGGVVDQFGVVQCIVGVLTIPCSQIQLTSGASPSAGRLQSQSKPASAATLPTHTPAWLVMQIQTDQPINTLRFNWRFAAGGEGLLRVFVNENLVRDIDQRFVPAVSPEPLSVYVGDLAPGTYKIAFRLDGYGANPSGVELTGIELGQKTSVLEDSVLMVSRAGTGSGTITSTPAGIDCGAICAASFGSDSNVTLTATPAADSTFAGWSPASCGSPLTLTDDTTCTATFNLANRPPVANAGPDQTVESTGPNGAVVTLDGSASSDPDNDPMTFAWTGPFGTVTGSNPTASLPLGAHTLTLTVDDGHGGTATDTVVVQVVDTTPPILTLPADISTDATSASGAAVTYTASAKDLVDGAVTPNCTPASGSTFPIGTTTVACTATDKAENTASGSFKVTVVGTTPPPGTSTFSTFSVNPLRINQRLKTLFLLSNFTLGQGNNGIDPTKEPVTLTIAGFTTTISPGSFRKGPAGVYAFAGKINNVAIEMLIAPLGNNRFGFQVAAYGANLSGTKNPVMVEFLIGDDSGTARVNNAIIR